MAKAGKSWTYKGTKLRYYYPNSPSKKGRYVEALANSRNRRVLRDIHGKKPKGWTWISWEAHTAAYRLDGN